MKKVVMTVLLLAGWPVMVFVMACYLGLLVMDYILAEWTDERP